MKKQTKENAAPAVKHTPGPWTISKVDPGVSEGASYALTTVVETEERHIAFCFSDSPADAQLIAAAPEMFNTLVEICDTFLNCPEHELVQKIEENYLRARNVLAEITGEEAAHGA